MPVELVEPLPVLVLVPAVLVVLRLSVRPRILVRVGHNISRLLLLLRRLLGLLLLLGAPDDVRRLLLRCAKGE